MKVKKNLLIVPILIISFSIGFYGDSIAHCDSMDGPVVKAAILSLEDGNINHALIWIHPEQEDEVRQAFLRAISIRHLNDEVRKVADLYFFETLVRLHRASEGAPYTGLKPAGTDPGPVVTAADKAIRDKSGHEIMQLITEAVHQGIHSRFHELLELADFAPDNVQAGREYVKAYVDFVHYLEPVYQAAAGTSHENVNGDFHDHH